ncbi:hypothetical protein CEXT_665061 [Caerostris extrusa]|uniref:Uncharacterized protein n=1 Tax=Caerostris extrusa TaxID=172846 RepID=A0AAV4RHP1_CAEEX|nr:hypothetical protein CEXT_665061 [Caerostris extrusa]
MTFKRSHLVERDPGRLKMTFGRQPKEKVLCLPHPSRTYPERDLNILSKIKAHPLRSDKTVKKGGSKGGKGSSRLDIKGRQREVQPEL